MKFVFAVCFLLSATLGFAAETSPVAEPTVGQRTPLWEGPSPVGDGTTDEAKGWITVHRPAKPNGTAMVICPGGGYGGLVVGAEGHGIAKWLTQHNITGVVLEYRLPAGRHAVPLLDTQRALRTVRFHAKDWNLDPERIGIIGFSAGGHVASTAATHFDDGDPKATDAIDRVSCRPDFAILVYPVVTMGKKTHQGSKGRLLGKDPSPDMVKLYSNELQVTAKTPPMFLAHAVDDTVVPPENSRELFASLQKNKNIASKYLELPSGGHGLNGYKGPMWDAWQEQSMTWLSSLNPPQENKAAQSEDPQSWPPVRESESVFTERKLESFVHGTRPEWGYAAPQRDKFLVLHPTEGKPELNGALVRPPLYVVLHSAGHNVDSCLACTATVGNHDIYRAPPEFFALYVDCRANKGDWWWGIEKYKGSEISPPEKRVIDTVKWVIEHYQLDENRVYLCGNSMGGSGTLGIGMRQGDLFAAIKANVPARVEHVTSRMFLPPATIPDGVTLADPPIVVDYSAQNDSWSQGHDAFAAAMNERQYAGYFYWGPFGHANDHAKIEKFNDLVNTFDWLSVRKNAAYPAFTNALTNDPLPWPDDVKSQKSGQINAFFRWKNISDETNKLEMSLFLTTPADLKTTFTIPTTATADVTLRRLQALQLAPGETFRWTFGEMQGETSADGTGHITIPQLTITNQPVTLKVERAN
ncbi:MAG: prolyl oligopeptidase family serine peptidase [Planctomycetaceae bacterium]